MFALLSKKRSRDNGACESTFRGSLGSLSEERKKGKEKGDDEKTKRREEKSRVAGWFVSRLPTSVVVIVTVVISVVVAVVDAVMIAVRSNV